MSIGFISTLLSQYGINQSGNIQTDLAELKKIMTERGESTKSIDGFANMLSQIEKAKNNKISTEEPKPTEQKGPPWNSLMQSLGLKLTGSIEGDFMAISKKLQEMAKSATTSEQKANIASLKAKFSEFSEYAPQAMLIGAEDKKSQNKPKITLPWDSLLKATGLQSQGSPQADFAAIAKKLQEMENADTTGAQKSTISALQLKLTKYKNKSSVMAVISQKLQS